MAINTPWGPAQSVKHIAPGITNITTAGHGGILLTEARQREVERSIPDYDCFAGRGWYEEDEDWALVALLFHEHFDDQAVYFAVETVRCRKSDHWKPVLNWLGTHDSIPAVRRANAYAFAVEGKWRVGSMGSSTPDGIPADCWCVRVRREGENKDVFMPYPEQPFYTDEELAELTMLPPPKKREKIGPFPSDCAVGNSMELEPSDADPGL